MSTRVERYRQELAALPRLAWDAFLLRESGLPGPRGNIELGYAVAWEGDEALFRRYLTFDAEQAPTNDPREFLAFCGTLGLGRLLVEGRADVWPLLRSCAQDARWRVREATAMALQMWGERSIDALLIEMAAWAQGSALERRAAIAALCEPRLLTAPTVVARVLELLDGVTEGIEHTAARRDDGFRALRQALGYCWSVAVAAWPEGGKPRFARWIDSRDPDVRWIARENLGKSRLRRLDAGWVESCLARWQRPHGETSPPTDTAR